MLQGGMLNAVWLAGCCSGDCIGDLYFLTQITQMQRKFSKTIDEPKWHKFDKKHVPTNLRLICEIRG